MKTLNMTKSYQPLTKRRLMPLAVITIAVSGALMSGCDLFDSSNESAAAFLAEEPEPLNVIGTSLYCGTPATLSTTEALGVETPDSIPSINISREEAMGDAAASELRPNAGNVMKRLSAAVPLQTPADGVVVDGGMVHPILVSYAEQVIGPPEFGDGSADIGDPNTIDDVFTSLSMDNGKTWKKVAVGDTSSKSSITVKWNALSTTYRGHSHKPQMGVQGDNILVAWNDKYCPSGNPFDLDLVADPEADYFKVNGSQGSIDYEGIIAPNGKTLYEVPFSCVWTARGVFADTDGDGTYAIEWRQAQQMTSGTRDSNKIWIASADVGFALTWQEDTQGLRSGKGAGPGEGYSGATTNHGTDIWYTYIPMENFADVCTDAECTATTDVEADIVAMDTKAKPAFNYAYPTRISNNEACSSVDEKVYCADHCFATVSIDTGNQSGTQVDRCVDDDLDYMTDDASILPAAAVLDGDTGASRPALKLLRTNAETLDAENEPEYVAILVYEETKGLSLSSPGDQDQGTVDTDIALEGKAVYFESFFWDKPEFAEVSAGRVVNLRVPDVDITYDDNNVITSINETGLDVYENARRVVIMGQVDACEMQDGDYTFGLLYKQGFDTRGGPSDMYIRMNTGFVYEDTEKGVGFEDTTSNVSARESVYDADGKVTSISWTTDNLLDQSYDNPLDNTFSPRGWLRGSEIYTGYEYTPNWRQTENGTTPNNFWMQSYTDAAWNGPHQVTYVAGAYGTEQGAHVSTLDPRFIPTSKGNDDGVAAGIASDASNPDVLFISYGTFDMTTSEELDIFYSRSLDKGVTWEFQDGAGNTVTIPGINDIEGDADDAYRHAKLAHTPDIDKEVQALGAPDGSMLFNVWMYETHALDALESEFGLVNYNFDPAAIP